MTYNFGTTDTKARVYLDPPYMDSNQTVKIHLIFGWLFEAGASMKEKNKTVLKFLDHLRTENRIDLIKAFLSETSALNDLHPSLLKSTLIMTENIEEIHELRNAVSDIFMAKVNP